MNFKILNWNIGGAKFLEIKTSTERKEKQDDINRALKDIIEFYKK